LDAVQQITLAFREIPRDQGSVPIATGNT